MKLASITPTTVEEVEDAVRQAGEESAPLEIHGGRSKSHVGRRFAGARCVDLSALNGIVSYEPAELILVAQPGLTLAEAESALAGNNQHLAFEPPHFGDAATIGGMVACGLSGPRRFKAGAVRDFVLGVEFVEGRGSRARAGGRVVKNVTGYDLPRTMTGAFGTLGVLTEICLKLWPRPETTRTLVIHQRGLSSALASMLAWAQLPLEISGLAFLPDTVDWVPGAAGRLCARVEGSEAAVSLQIDRLKDDLAGDASPAAHVEELDGDDSSEHWRQIRELEFCSASAAHQRWRFCPPPAAAAQLVEALSAEGLIHFNLDWGGGLVWALFPGDVEPSRIHGVARSAEATSWRFCRCPEDPNDEAFAPLDPGEERVHRQLKTAFDPLDILNRGRMYSW